MSCKQQEKFEARKVSLTDEYLRTMIKAISYEFEYELENPQKYRTEFWNLFSKDEFFLLDDVKFEEWDIKEIKDVSETIKNKIKQLAETRLQGRPSLIVLFKKIVHESCDGCCFCFLTDCENRFIVFYSDEGRIKNFMITLPYSVHDTWKFYRDPKLIDGEVLLFDVIREFGSIITPMSELFGYSAIIN